MDKKKSKYKDDYSLRTLAYYQREGGIYNELITILQRIRTEGRYEKLPSPNKILNLACEAFDIVVSLCQDDDGHYLTFTEDNIEGYLEDISIALFGSSFLDEPHVSGLLSNSSSYLSDVVICVLGVLMSKEPELSELKHYIVDTIKDNQPDIYGLFSHLIETKGEIGEQIEFLKKKIATNEKERDEAFAEIAKLQLALERTKDELSKFTLLLEKEKNKLTKFERALTLDTILLYAENLQSHERAQQIFGLLSYVARNIATDEEYEKIDAANNRLLAIQASQTNIYHQMTAYGSNIFSGIVKNPNFPVGMTAEEVYKQILPYIERKLREINK